MKKINEQAIVNVIQSMVNSGDISAAMRSGIIHLIYKGQDVGIEDDLVSAWNCIQAVRAAS